MTAKEFLQGFRAAELRLKMLDYQLDVLKGLQAVPDDVLKTIRLQAKKARNRQIQVLTGISAVPDPVLQHLLMLRYIKGFTWESIADELCYSVARCYDLHKEALKQIKLPEGSKENE